MSVEQKANEYKEAVSVREGLTSKLQELDLARSEIDRELSAANRDVTRLGRELMEEAAR